jgi:hypothetical protein
MRHLPNLVSFSRQTDIVNDSISPFGNVGFNKNGEYMYTSRRITGINRPIRIKIDYDDSLAELFYSINYFYVLPGTDFTDVFSPVALGFTLLSAVETITIYPNDYLYFGAEPFDTGINFAQVTNSLNNSSLISNITVQV